MPVADQEGFSQEKRHRLPVDDGQLSYSSWGEGQHQVCVVPGSLSSSIDWEPVANLLSRRCTVHVLDRRGYGDSTGAGEYQRTVSTEASDVSNWLDQVGPAVLVGHSYGGAVALLASGPARSSLLGLQLIEPVLPAGRPIGTREKLRDMEEFLADGKREEALILGLQAFVRLTADEIAAVRGTPRWSRMRSAVHNWPDEVRALNDLLDSHRSYRPLSVPTSVLRGAETATHFVASSEAIAKSLGVPVDVIAGVGHASFAAMPEEVARRIEQFVVKNARQGGECP